MAKSAKSQRGFDGHALWACGHSIFFALLLAVHQGIENVSAMDIEFGTLGQWVGGLGSVFVGLVALWNAGRSERLAAEHRMAARIEAAYSAAAHLALDVWHLLDDGEPIDGFQRRSLFARASSTMTEGAALSEEALSAFGEYVCTQVLQPFQRWSVLASLSPFAPDPEYYSIGTDGFVASRHEGQMGAFYSDLNGNPLDLNGSFVLEEHAFGESDDGEITYEISATRHETKTIAAMKKTLLAEMDELDDLGLECRKIAVSEGAAGHGLLLHRARAALGRPPADEVHGLSW